MPSNHSSKSKIDISESSPSSPTLNHDRTKSQRLIDIKYSTYSTFKNVFKEYRNRDCFGWREKVEVSEEYPFGLGQYQWITYEEFQKSSEYFGNALAHLIPSRSFVGVCANNCIEWYYADFGCLWYGMRVVPYHHQINCESMLEMLTNSETSCMIISKVAFAGLVDIITKSKYRKIKLIIHIEDDFDEETRLRLPPTIQFRLFSNMMETGRRITKLKHNPIKKDEILSLIYSSGSTGLPKGVITSDRDYNQYVYSTNNEYPHVAISYTTLAHVQRRSDHKVLYCGGRIGLFSGNMETLFDDLRLLRPHSFWAVPRIWNIIHAQYQHEITQYQSAAPSSSSISRNQAELVIGERFKLILGDRIQMVMTGSAPTSPAVMEFIKRTWAPAPVLTLYGCTEALVISVNDNVLERVDYKIVPVEEFGYSPDDQPYPRGELHVKVDLNTGYYRNDQANNQAFQDGWYKTGDIIEQYAPRKIRVIDRKKNAFKLANGEFVAPEKIENMFYASEIIEHIFIYGYIDKTFLTAIVVPKEHILHKHKLTIDSSKEEVEENLPIRNEIMNELERISKLKSLANYEIPKMITIDNNKWTIESGMITGSGKFCRSIIYNHYVNDFMRMNDTIESIQTGLRSQTTEEKSDYIETYLRLVLGLDSSSESIDLSKLSFTQMGGDSVGAVRLSSLLKEKANIDISPQFILNKNNNMNDISNIVKSGSSSSVNQVSIDWSKEMELDSDITAVGKSAKPIKSVGNNVFLTGATGFLGAFLLFDLLANRGATIGNVYCLVRGQSVEAAKSRLLQKLCETYRLVLSSEMIDRIIVVIGDLEAERLGIANDQYNQLVENVDLIIHNGAYVHLLNPYPNMKGTNVGGTAEVLRLASAVGQQHSISVAHISTIGCFSERNKVITEFDKPNVDHLDKMFGYTQSKLVAEQLVTSAHRTRNIQAIILRPGTIYASSETGIDNEHDFVRLVFRSILHLGSYPKLNNQNGGSLLNLSPVDWVASSVTNLSLNQQQQHQQQQQESENIPIYHLINQHNISLSEFCKVVNDKVTPLLELEFDEWKSRLLSQPTNPLHSMSLVFNKEYPVFSSYGFSNPLTLQKLIDCGMNACPYVSKKLIIKNIRYLQQLKN
ncbi:hypothetical protein PPL_02983 [Heterostelium album PN500]|uniref:Carrier domain-containing protein n=1 Tax=Heterostelium pallidum (strain ATCC 26659 / Pp 5 / PN500) TaxID=670386 RepID=D3B3L5_HETP5|nr:hypothetical protein PPL_02983 [Heterostelium album PN500]EFA83913.1 hypothetical protein PPL_02983 [Heterostelium album PN500]|eukprot:XP_020436030.1 hypothetical protein PPL_02983 [Heterostelium album PN500]